MNKTNNRSGCEDRRLEDIGPPKGWQDRRKRVERRIPETIEIEVSEAEWAAYFERHTEESGTGQDAPEASDRVHG